MRIADKMGYEQVKTNLSDNRAKMSDLQNQAATQKRLTKPSDDPLAATRVLAARTEINGGQQFLKSLNQARAFLEYSDQSLGELTEILSRAKELAISQANDASAGKNTREVVAAEIEQLHDQAVQVGNRKLGDRFLFAGYKTTRAPFDAQGNYRGDNGEMQIVINKEASVAMNLPGNRVFLGQNLGERTGSGRSGGYGGENSSSPALEQDKKAPTDVGPGPAPLFQSHQMGRGPASIRPPYAQTNSASVESKTPDDEAGGPDLGASWRQGVNLFKTLKALEISMRANDKAGVQDSLDVLDGGIAQVVLARAQLGARVTTLNSGMETLQKGQVDAKGLASSLEDADTFELVSDINKTENTLKASLATSGKLIQPSLLDFLK